MRYKTVEIYQTPGEVKNIRLELQKIKDIPGDIAEVGVFEGASACIIREEIKDKDLYLFDTFCGFADELHETDAKHYFVGDCSASRKHVEDLLKDEKNVFITEGKFPDTSDIIKDKKFAFAHIDVDIYQATKNSLEFFWTRMSPGGTILIHDYPAHRGVKLAVDEFLKDKDKKVEIIGVEGRQAAIRM